MRSLAKPIENSTCVFYNFLNKIDVKMFENGKKKMMNMNNISDR